MSTTRKTLAAVAAALPFSAVLAVALYMVVRIIAHTGPRYGRRLPDLVTLLLHDSPFSDQEWIGLGISILAIAFLQMGMAAIFITDLVRNVQVSTGVRIAWIIAMVFIGSFGLPAYWLVHVAAERGRRDRGADPPARDGQ